MTCRSDLLRGVGKHTLLLLVLSSYRRPAEKQQTSRFERCRLSRFQTLRRLGDGDLWGLGFWSEVLALVFPATLSPIFIAWCVWCSNQD
jgi:hypothetical protein